jgi:hypothetical protein
MVRPPVRRPDAAQFLLNCMLGPADFIGHCNIRSSLNVASKFRTSKKRCLRVGHGHLAD